MTSRQRNRERTKITTRRGATSARTGKAKRLETAADLLRLIRKLPEKTVEAERLAWKIVRRDYGKDLVPREQKEHWTGWLEEYDGPGFYGRKTANRSAEYIYNHLHCAPMLLWLAEHAGVPTPVLHRAARAAGATDRSGPSNPAQAAALRAVIPWSEVEWRLLDDVGGVEARLRTWIPDRARRSALVHALARSCAHAAQQAPRCWGVSLLAQKISLNVGMVNVFVLGRQGTLSLLVRPELVPAQFQRRLDPGAYANARRSRMLFLSTLPRERSVDEKLREAHHAAINETSVTRLTEYLWQSAHSRELVKFLERETGMAIPDPRRRWAGQGSTR
jgi:hypothetical protein